MSSSNPPELETGAKFAGTKMHVASETYQKASKSNQSRMKHDARKMEKSRQTLPKVAKHAWVHPRFHVPFFSFSFSCPDHSSKMQTAVLHLVNKLNNIPDADCLRQFTFVYQYYRTRRWRKFQK